MARTVECAMLMLVVLGYLGGAAGQYHGFNPWAFVEEPPMTDDPMPGYGGYNPWHRYYSNGNSGSRNRYQNNGMYNMFWARRNMDF